MSPIAMPAAVMTRPAKQSWPAEGIELAIMPPLARSSSLASNASGPICMITHELIASLAPEDRFVTLDGQVYQKAALKCWLSKHDTLPNRGSGVEDAISRLWPEGKALQSPVSRLGFKTYRAMSLGSGVAATGSILAGTLTLLQSFPHVWVRISPSTYDGCAINRFSWYEDYTQCADFFSKQTATYRPIGASLLGLSVCLAGASIASAIAARRAHNREAEPQENRSVTSAEREAAGFGGNGADNQV